MTQTCAVLNCHSPKNVSYHRFPRDLKMIQKWLTSCYRGEINVNPKTARICSRHFSATDYIRDLKNELLGLPTKKFLKPTAVPTLLLGHESPINNYLLSPKQETPEDIQNRDNQIKRERSIYVQEILSSCDPSTYFTNTVFSKRKKKDFTFEECPNDKCVQTDRFILIDEADKKIHRLQRQVSDLKYAIKMLNKSRARLKSKKHTRCLVKNELLKYYSSAQVNFLLGKKRKSCKWSDEDIKTGLVLRSMISRKAYKFLRDKRLFPVPGLTTIRQRLKKIDTSKISALESECKSKNEEDSPPESPGTTISAYSDGDGDLDEVETDDYLSKLTAIVSEGRIQVLHSSEQDDLPSHQITLLQNDDETDSNYIQEPSLHQITVIQQSTPSYQHIVDLQNYYDMNISVAQQEVSTNSCLGEK